MALLDGWFPTTAFGTTGSPDAMGNDPDVNELLQRLQMAQAQPSEGAGMLPFAGMVVDRPPAAAQKNPAMAPSVEPATLETGAQQRPEVPSTKVGSRLPSEIMDATTGGVTTIPKMAPAKGGNLAAPPPPAPDFSPSFGERLSNFGDALTGRSYVNFDEQGRQRKSTYDALIGMGLDPKMAEAAVRQPELLKAIVTAKLGSKNRTQYGLQPQWNLRTKPDGTQEWVMTQMGDDATAVETRIPPDLTPVPPGDIAGAKRYGTKLGEASADAEAMLSSVKTTVENAFDTINKLRTHDGLDTATGTSGFFDPRNYIWGTDAWDFAELNKQSQSQAFMAAREGLKGAGQVTDFEGTKGEQAIANLARAQSKRQYLDALDTLEKMMRRSYEDMQRKANLGHFGVGGRGGGSLPNRPKNMPPGAREGRDGNIYMPDPDRPGGYLRWVP